jgi:hypothetical protein
MSEIVTFVFFDAGLTGVISMSETTVNVACVTFNVTLVDVYFASKYLPRESCGTSMF